MRIIGCDLHARQQSLAMLETTTGEVVEVTLKHEGGIVREFYSSLPRPVRAGIEATGSMQWFFESHGRAGNRMSGRASGTDSRIRAAEAEKRSARCRFDSEAAGRKSLSGDLVTYQGATGSAVFVAAPSSVGTHADANTKCVAADSPGEWSPPRHRPMEPRRTKPDRLVVVGTPYGLSAE
jgi:hypothetical protein